MPRGGAQQRSSFDNPPSLEESRTRPEPERRREADEGERPVRGMGGRLPRRRGRFGYSSPRGGERAGAAEGDALTSPSRSSTPRRLSPPVCTPTSRRRPPQRGHWKTSTANTRRSSAAHDDRSGGEPQAPGDGSANGPVPSLGPAAVVRRRGMTSDRHAADGPSTP